MTNEALYLTINEIDDAFILNAEPRRGASRTLRHLFPLAAAACILIAAGLVTWLSPWKEPEPPVITVPPNTTDTNSHTSDKIDTGTSDTIQLDPNKEYTIYVHKIDSAGEIVPSTTKKPSGIYTTGDNASAKLDFELEETTIELSSPPEEKRTLTLDGMSYTLTFQKATQTGLSTSADASLRKNATLLEYALSSSFTAKYSEKTGDLIYFYRYVPNTTKHLDEKTLKERASEIAKEIYGEEFIRQYTIVGASTGDQSFSQLATVSFCRQIHGYNTEDWVVIYFKGNECMSVNAYKMDYLESHARKLTKTQIQTAEKVMQGFLEDQQPSYSRVTVNSDGKLYFLAGVETDTETIHYWVEIED